MNINQKRSRVTKAVLKRFPDLTPEQQVTKVTKELKKFEGKKK